VARTCSIEGCSTIHWAKGMCRRHYRSTPKSLAQRQDYLTRHRADLAGYRRNAKAVFSNAKSQAKSRKLEWDITLEQLVRLRSNVCHYCQFPLAETGTGLDRRDNDAGYTLSNVIPCCADCNRTRGDRYSYEEMLELAPSIRQLKLRREQDAMPVSPIEWDDRSEYL
jgi:hypothetical protein